jgi:hypothetical protein
MAYSMNFRDPPSQEDVACGCNWMAYLGDRSLAALAILYPGAYGNMEVDKQEEEPSFDTSSGRDDDLSSLPAHDDDGTKDVAYNVVAMGFSLEHNMLD